MNPIAIRLLSQQLVSPQFASPKDVVSHMGAMQAQDYRMVRWAAAMRTKKPSAREFQKAYDTGEIIRLHLLRGTWQLVAGEDYWWMLDLCAPNAMRALGGWMKANKVTIDDRELHSVQEVLVKTAEDMASATKDDFAEALAARGITMDSHRLSYHLRLAELSGTLCSGDLSPMKATYALAEKKVRRTPRIDRDEMLTLLTRKYFQSHSPATLEDFVWWAGLTTNDCRKGMGLLSAELHKEVWRGRTFYLHDSCRTRGFRKGTTLLLPPFDEYLIGYKSRELVVAPENVPRTHTNNGIFFPVIAHDGIICGNWKPWEKTLQVCLFEGHKEIEVPDKQWNTFCKIIKSNYK